MPRLLGRPGRPSSRLQCFLHRSISTHRDGPHRAWSFAKKNIELPVMRVIVWRPQGACLALPLVFASLLLQVEAQSSLVETARSACSSKGLCMCAFLHDHESLISERFGLRRGCSVNVTLWSQTRAPHPQTSADRWRPELVSIETQTLSRRRPRGHGAM